MEQFLNQLSKGFIAFAAIAGAIVFLFVSDPPHSVCDTEIENFKKRFAGKLFEEKSKFLKAQKPTKLKTLNEHCKFSNSPGGCYELFGISKNILEELNKVPLECNRTLAGIKEVKNFLWQSTELLIRMAWGEKPPETYYQKYGWLDQADMNLFCKFKEKVKTYYQPQKYKKFQEKFFTELPGTDKMPRDKIWDRSILSANCAKF